MCEEEKVEEGFCFIDKRERERRERGRVDRKEGFRFDACCGCDCALLF